MTDAERLAKALHAEVVATNDWNDTWLRFDQAAQRLIDSGVVTVNPPPDPAERARIELRTVRHLIDEGWIGTAGVADRIVVDLCTPHARAAAALLHLLSGGGIAFRRSWLIRDGEPVWHLEADRG